MFTSLSQFYNSNDWRQVRNGIVASRLTVCGETICEHCGKPIVKSFDMIAHHVKPLTMQNVNDYTVSMNPENIKLVHAKCHNEIHSRFGYQNQKKVYLVWGAPCSGKTTYVMQNKGNSDLVVDIDSIWEALTGERYEKPDALKTNVFTIRDMLLEQVKTRTGKWERAYVIGGYPVRSQRMRSAELLGAEMIYIKSDIKTCCERLQVDEKRFQHKDKWMRYIKDYFDQLEADE